MWPCENTCDGVLNLLKLYVYSEKDLWETAIFHD